MARNSGLGRGLGALLSEDFNTSGEAPSEVLNVPINEVYPRKDQPRKHFDEDALEDLAESIKNHGVIQSLLVTEQVDGYEIVAGERRYRASKIAGLEEVPVIVKELTNKEIKEISLIENIQREDLNPIEEAYAYRSLINDYDMTQETVAETVGKSRSYVANILRLLNLEEDIQNYLIEGEITSSQGRTLLSIKDRKERYKTLQDFLNKETNIREVEKKKKNKNKKQDPFVVDIENRLTESLEAKVALKAKKKGGQIVINYYDNDDLDRLINILEV